MIDLKNLTIKKAHEHLVQGDFTARELAAAYTSEIEKRNPEINAYLEVFSDIDEQAQVADERIKAGKATLLTGIPLSIKDNILIEGRIASSASKMLENYRATYDATVIKKLKDAGAVFLGRTNMDEFAMGSSTENSAYGVVKNPHDTSRVPGGSSGGAAAALASNMCLASIGSDTGGSIRQPACFTGLVGLKPTYGKVSRYGLMAMASSLDQIGPLTKNTEDAEILFDILKGKDPMDSTSIEVSIIHEEKKLFKIGVPFDFLKEGIDKDVMDNFTTSLETLKNQGYEIVDVKLPHAQYALAVYYIMMPAEISSNLARFDGVKYGLHKDGKDLLEDYLFTRHEGFGAEARRRIILGTYVLSSGYYDAYYNKAMAVRALLKKDYEVAFKNVDIVLVPTSPVPSFKIGERSEDPLSMYLADIFTVSANITSLPAISIPSGFVEREGKHLPVGIQFTAAHAREDILFSIGKIFENVRS
ncbi:MAG: Asp-tRNA(Asn)/Glu-tRNA(Gln) amidotransferase subunit GatA [bacterium]|nr:Asp-tRNA(Asn)/Glu-tRNA(Gln) amidotransferase subunit GatA [bacterium]